MNSDEKIILRVLAVNDPAIEVYVDKKYDILGHFADDLVSIEFDIIPWNHYSTTMMKTFKGEEAYDIIMVAGHLWLADFVDKQYLEPMEYDFEDILPIVADEMQYQGITYLSPSFCDGHMIVYHKNILESVLERLPDTAITVNEYLGIVQRLGEKGIFYPTALKAHPSEILLDALPYLRSTGIDLYQFEDDREMCNIGSMVAGLMRYLKLRAYAPAETNMFGNEEIKDMIIQKKAAITVTWSGQLGAVKRESENVEDLGFSTFDTAWNATWSFGIVKNSKNKDKAMEFLAYLRSKPIDTLVGDYCGAPVRKTNYMEGMDTHPWYKVQLEMLEKYAHPFIGIKHAHTKNSILYEEIYQAFIGEKKAARAMDDASARIKAIEETHSF